MAEPEGAGSALSPTQPARPPTPLWLRLSAAQKELKKEKRQTRGSPHMPPLSGGHRLTLPVDRLPRAAAGPGGGVGSGPAHGAEATAAARSRSDLLGVKPSAAQDPATPRWGAGHGPPVEVRSQRPGVLFSPAPALEEEPGVEAAGAPGLRPVQLLTSRL